MKNKKQSWASRLHGRLFPPYQWQEGEYGKVMVHAETNWMYFYVRILKVNGDTIEVDYLNKRLMHDLLLYNPTWWFINPIDRKQLIHLAYDEQVQALITEEKNKV